MEDMEGALKQVSSDRKLNRELLRSLNLHNQKKESSFRYPSSQSKFFCFFFIFLSYYFLSVSSSYTVYSHQNERIFPFSSSQLQTYTCVFHVPSVQYYNILFLQGILLVSKLLILMGVDCTGLLGPVSYMCKELQLL